MKKLFYILCAACLMASCIPAPAVSENDMSTVYFEFDSVAVKSLAVADDYISNCNILVYDTAGHLATCAYSATGGVGWMQLDCTAGSTYKFYCVCNIGDITGNPLFTNESYLEGYQYSVDSYSDIVDAEGAVPMTGHTGLINITDGMCIHIDLTRCVALVSISIDDSGLQNSEISIHSVTVRNAPCSVGLFSSSGSGNPGDFSSTGDSADTMELSTFNSGSEIGFYMFENCQGVLLPSNDSCRSKYFADGSEYEQLCSYIELEGYYNDTASSNPRRGDFTYRFYLGGDTETDFSVVRNHHYHIVLKLYDDGVDEESWRVDSDIEPYATAVIVDPPAYSFPSVAGTVTLSATVLPATASQEVIWSSGNPAVATVDQNGVVTPHAIGTTVIKATVTDGSGVFGTSTIRVQEPSVPVRIEPNYLKEDGWMLGAGSETYDFKVTVYYADGTTRILTGEDALATIDNDNEWVISEGWLCAPDMTIDLDFLLSYRENGHMVSFASEGVVVAADDFFTATLRTQIDKKYGDDTDRPYVITNIQCYRDQAADLSQWLTFTCNSNYLEQDPLGYRLKGGCTLNGDFYFTLTGSLIDSFRHPFSKSITHMSTVFEYRRRFYNVHINTMVRDSIDPGGQDQPDNIIVTVTMVKSWESSELIGRYFFPASYDQNTGELVQGFFTYRWYKTVLNVQMQDDREYEFNYDNEGNLLLDGFCYDENKYIYYDPL